MPVRYECDAAVVGGGIVRVSAAGAAAMCRDVSALDIKLLQNSLVSGGVKIKI